MNRLSGETSPYLRQHAGNPVDWYPWGDEAFALARSTDRPVFLSVGYSACHWCHVMAHESFEDDETARILNASFVSVKVDREERPDVDALYMEAVQAPTGAGGWPMSVFLTPDQRPFFGGTYFPPTDRPGMPSFRTVLAALADAWEHRRPEVEAQAADLAAAVAAGARLPGRTVRENDTEADRLVAGDHAAADRLLDKAAGALAARFDRRWGGFGGAPKFPQPALCDLALYHGAVRGDPASREMATATLGAMAAGGIHDHLDGGFARYSTDVEWLVPHFEKMLYDQAGLLSAFLHALQVTGWQEARAVIEGVVAYTIGTLGSPGGGLYSSEDADADGVEGRFSTWTPAQVVEAVGPGAAPAVLDWFGVTEQGNFEGATILHRPLGAPLTGPPHIEHARRRLLAARAERVRPGLDDKVLTEWNAMFCASLAEAAGALDRPDWAGHAVEIGEFLWRELRRHDGRFLRSWQAGAGPRHLACAGDHAWLVEAALRLAELTGDVVWTRRAVEVAEALIELFADDVDGGFFTAGSDGERLLVRTKDLFDGAMPSANGVAARALARLYGVTGETRYLDRARGCVALVAPHLVEQPLAFPTMVLTACMLARGPVEVVVAGDRVDLLRVVRRRWLPGAVLAWGEPTGSPLWEGREAGNAYVCTNHACLAPATDPDMLEEQLAAAAGWS
ncbi:MAG: thioredoxin domain-containing protein [Acidimicrobiales bacterium]